MTSAPFDHPVFGAWMGDAPTLAQLSWGADLDAMLRFWSALAIESAGAGIIPEDAVGAIAAALAAPMPSHTDLALRMRADGVVVPGLVAKLRARMPDPMRPFLHRGATSQDVIDSALMIRLSSLLDGHAGRLSVIDETLAALSDRYGARPLMAVTRMRDAMPIAVSDRIAVWRAEIAAAAATAIMTKRTLPIQLAGPVGTLESFGPSGPAVRAGMARRLGLRDPGRGWHATRSPILQAAVPFETAARALGKLGLDLGFMAQDGTATVTLEGGASSSMPHKVNPVDAELLVAVSRQAASAFGALAGAGLHELERSGAGWTQEWIALPQLVACAGSSIAAAERLLAAIRDVGRLSR